MNGQHFSNLRSLKETAAWLVSKRASKNIPSVGLVAKDLDGLLEKDLDDYEKARKAVPLTDLVKLKKYYEVDTKEFFLFLEKIRKISM